MFNPDRAPLVGTAEVARRLGVTPQTIARRVRSGALTPAAQAPGLRGALLFDAEQVEQLAAAQRSAGPAEAVAR